MRWLIDSSVWIDYFSPRGKRRLPVLDALESWIQEGETVTLLPVLAELRSGTIRPRLNTLLEHLEKVDLDWNASATWDEIADLGRRFGGIGIVDRMILLAAHKNVCQVVTFDQRLARAAHALGVGLR